MQITAIGLDIAKNVTHIVAAQKVAQRGPLMTNATAT